MTQILSNDWMVEQDRKHKQNMKMYGEVLKMTNELIRWKKEDKKIKEAK